MVLLITLLLMLTHLGELISSLHAINTCNAMVIVRVISVAIFTFFQQALTAMSVVHPGIAVEAESPPYSSFTAAHIWLISCQVSIITMLITNTKVTLGSVVLTEDVWLLQNKILLLALITGK